MQCRWGGFINQRKSLIFHRPVAIHQVTDRPNRTSAVYNGTESIKSYKQLFLMVFITSYFCYFCSKTEIARLVSRFVFSMCIICPMYCSSQPCINVFLPSFLFLVFTFFHSFFFLFCLLSFSSSFFFFSFFHSFFGFCNITDKGDILHKAEI